MSESFEHNMLYRLVDPTIKFGDNGDMPLLTTMLRRVCNNDRDKFEEAARLLELAIAQTVTYTMLDNNNAISNTTKERDEADISSGSAWRLLRRYKYRVRHLLADVQKALDAMNQPHYGSNDTELDNYYDAKSILENIIENKR